MDINYIVKDGIWLDFISIIIKTDINFILISWFYEYKD